ncbi:MAG: hypothetical protein SNJ81_01085 [Cyanobacteriota bacterium]
MRFANQAAGNAGYGAIAMLQDPLIHSMGARFGALCEPSLTRCLNKDV